MARITLIEETVIGFEYNEEVGAFSANFNPSPFVPIEGETYKIVWDNTEWSCVAFNVDSEPDLTFLGNTYALGGPDTGEPFFYSCLKNGDGATLFTFDSQSTHIITIYQEAADEIDSEAIILKNRDGVDIAYSGVDTVKFNKVDGSTQTFIRGEVVEDMPIEVDFSEGNQTINAPAGILVKSAIIQKPENLIPQNIVKDIEIAGVVGMKDIPTGEATTINLDFSDGNMSVLPDGNKLFSKVDIPKPNNLTPENIALGIDVAGVVGTLAAGGSGGGSGSGSEILVDNEPEWIDDICFWDYDGTLIEHIPVSEAVNLTSLPEVPEHEGLTFAGWNYTLEELQVVTYPRDVGAMYYPTDNKTHIKLVPYSTSYLEFPFCFQQSVSEGVSIDWGDGSAVETISGTGSVTATHKYASLGEYHITFTVTSGTLTLGGGSSSTPFVKSNNYYSRAVKEIYIAKDVKLADYGLNYLSEASNVILPVNISVIPQSTLYSGNAYLNHLVIPRGVTTINNSCFSSIGTSTYRKESAISLPETVVSIGTTNCLTYYYYCARFLIPQSVTTFNIPGSWYNAVRMFLPEGRTHTVAGSGSLQSWRRLKKFDTSKIKPNTSNFFYGEFCSLEKIEIPEGVVTLGSHFGAYASAREIIIPSTVTTIGTSFLANSYSPKRIIIKGRLSTNVAMTSCHCQEMIYLHTSPNKVMTPPVSQICDIYVPDSAIDAYKTAFGTTYKHLVKPLSEYPGELPV